MTASRTPSLSMHLASFGLCVFALGAVASAVAGAGCATRGGSDQNAIRSADEAKANLTQAQAQARTKSIHNPVYKLSVRLDATSPSFSGETEVRFELKDLPADLALDFRGGTVRELSINGKQIKGAAQANGRVALPVAALAKGPNVVVVKYEQTYSRNGRGLHRFQDPEDGRVYLFTQFETFDANHLFPCFDQPDLKATFELAVEAPSDWAVISAMRESEIKRGTSPQAPSLWRFPPSDRMSAYVFSLHAGPYAEWTSQAGRIPLRLYARKSLARYVEPEVWFKNTRAGFSFFESYFGIPYPFHKYDQVVAPEFNAGAMENVAAVTYSERLVTRGQASRAERATLANIIFHEMAHMWFGDLVTMGWWDGLWLNESFATYAASLAAERTKTNPEAWIDFNLHSKNSAYRADQLVTTHSIHSDIPDVESALVNFDAITYGKGAATVRQLAFFVGEPAFRKGLSAYLRAHAYGNADLPDFIGAVEKASGRNLSAWSDRWLRESGVDSVQTRWACESGRISSFDLVSTAPSGQAKPRAHRTSIGLFQLRGEKLTFVNQTSVHYDAPVTPVASLIGKPCPDFVHPNYGDHDYVKVRLDPISMRAAKLSLSSLTDDLSRATIWPILQDMLRDGEVSAAEYIELALVHLPKETRVEVVEATLQALGANGVLRYLPITSERDRLARDAYGRKLEDMAWHELERATSAGAGRGDWQRAWLDGFIALAESPKALQALEDLLTDEGAAKRNLKGIRVDPDRRWAIVVRLNARGAESAMIRLESEKARDPSDSGQRYALAALAARPDEKAKAASWSTAIEAVGLPIARRRAILGNIFPPWQDEWRDRYSERFFTELKARSQTAAPEYLDALLRAAPTTCTKKSQTDLEEFYRSRGADLSPSAKKPLRIALQENARCLNLRAKAETEMQMRTPTSEPAP